MKTSEHTVSFAAALIAVLLCNTVHAGSIDNDDALFGFKVRMGGRYDNVRKCVASKTGTKGGIAADVSAFVELPAGDNAAFHLDLPLMRPILFALAFKMLQFEPTIALKLSDGTDGAIGWVAGPALGVSLHFGPDFNSEASGPGRTESFFAMGPIIGVYGGLDFRRPKEKLNFQLGLSPYITPLFGINDSRNHRGIVVGGLVDGTFNFRNSKQ